MSGGDKEEGCCCNDDDGEDVTNEADRGKVPSTFSRNRLRMWRPGADLAWPLETRQTPLSRTLRTRSAAAMALMDSEPATAIATIAVGVAAATAAATVAVAVAAAGLVSTLGLGTMLQSVTAASEAAEPVAQ
jgi:hypothetical protein